MEVVFSFQVIFIFDIVFIFDVIFTFEVVFIFEAFFFFEVVIIFEVNFILRNQGLSPLKTLKIGYSSNPCGHNQAQMPFIIVHHQEPLLVIFTKETQVIKFYIK